MYTSEPSLIAVVPWTVVAWHVHDEDGHVVVLLMTGEHMVEQVLEQTPGSVLQVLRSARGDADQLIQPGVEAAHPVLHEPVGVEHRGAARRQPERVLLAGTRPAKRRARLGLVEHGKGAGGEQQGGQVAAFPAWPSPVSGSITR